MKIEIRDFQAIESLSLDVSGFTVITGPSNTGKSAVVRAIAGAILGIPGDYYIRDEARSCKVKIDDAKATIEWVKVRKKIPGLQTSLTVNGQLSTLVGREHAILTSDFGVKELVTQDKERLTPQIAFQMDPVFLVGSTEATSAELFKLLGRVDVVTTAHKNAKSDLRDVEQRKDLREEDKIKKETQVKAVTSCEFLRQKWATLEGRSAECAQQELLVAKLDSSRVRLESLKPRVLPRVGDGKEVVRGRKIMELFVRWNEVVSATIPVVPVIEEAKLTKKAQALDLIRSLVVLTESLRVTAAQKDEARIDEFVIVDEKTKVMKELGVCPLCERSF